MSDREKLEKVYNFVKSLEDYSYKEERKYEVGSMTAMQYTFQASLFQRVRYFIEILMEENEVTK